MYSDVPDIARWYKMKKKAWDIWKTLVYPHSIPEWLAKKQPHWSFVPDKWIAPDIIPISHDITMISLTSHINLGLEPRSPENDPLAFQRRMNREISPGVEWKPQKWWNLGWFLVGIQWGKKMGKAWFKHINVHCSCNWLITIRLVSPQIVGLFMFLLYYRILQHISTNGLVVSKHDYQPLSGMRVPW